MNYFWVYNRRYYDKLIIRKACFFSLDILLSIHMSVENNPCDDR